MTDELKLDAQLKEEQLEQAAGGADVGKGCIPSKRDCWGRPIRWIELSTGKRFHYYCKDCGGLAPTKQEMAGLRVPAAAGTFLGFLPKNATASIPTHKRRSIPWNRNLI